MTKKKPLTATTHRNHRGAVPREGSAARSLLLAAAILLPSGVVLYAAAPPRGHRARSHTASIHSARAGVGRTTAATSTADLTFARDAAPLVKQYCLGCHSGANAAAGIRLDSYHTAASVLAARDVWENVSLNVKSSRMPPVDAPHPTAAQRERLAGWIESTLSKGQCLINDPGRVTLRRLNRAEYNNTIRDLVGVDFHPADDFPSDDVGYGFDNIGDVLSLSPLLMEKYLAAAETIAEKAIVVPDQDRKTTRFEADRLPDTKTSSVSDLGRTIFTEGAIGTNVAFPKTGDYLLRVRAFGEQAGPDPVKMAIRLDTNDVKQFDVRAVEGSPQVYEVRLPVEAGRHRFDAAFLNDFYDETLKSAKDRNLVVEYLEVSGPLGLPTVLPESQKRIIFCEPTDSDASRHECARKILGEFARRAYRRPVTADEVDRLVRYVDMAHSNGESFERGIQLGMEAIMVSPNFLFHVEIDPEPNNPKSTHPINNYELASRLSYFLWSSMPDDELFNAAAKGDLGKPAVMNAEVKRMLQDPRSRSLADNFAGQWLELRNLSIATPDPSKFPDWNDGLRAAMRTETEMFFESIVQEDHRVTDFLDGRYTFVNGALAKHYGIPHITGTAFQRVGLTGVERGGILTQGSVLTVTSDPTRTSPVKRGKWVLENILDTPPPAQPPNIPALPDDKGAVLTGTLRQRLEQHRKNPACASCHALMDPIGFGLENFDATGAWRTQDGGLPIDSSGKLVDGRTFRGPAQLRAILMQNKKQFVHCLSDKLLTYALGRGLESYDRCALDKIVNSVAAHDYRFSALITAVVQSDPFRKRRGDGGVLS